MTTNTYERLNTRPDACDRKFCLIKGSTRYEAEVAAIKGVAKHRFMSTSQLHVELALQGHRLSQKQLYKLIRPLWENGIFDIPTFWAELRRYQDIREKVYALGSIAAGVLGDCGLDPSLAPVHSERGNDEGKVGFGQHTLMTNQFSLALRLALRDDSTLSLDDLKLENKRKRPSTTGVTWTEYITKPGTDPKEETYRVYPDILVRLCANNKASVFLVEIDTSSERGTKMHDKFVAFAHLLRHCISVQEKGASYPIPRVANGYLRSQNLKDNPWYVLFVVRTHERRNYLQRRLRVLKLPKRLERRFLFLSESDYNAYSTVSVVVKRNTMWPPESFTRCHQMLQRHLYTACDDDPTDFLSLIAPQIQITPQNNSKIQFRS